MCKVSINENLHTWNITSKMFVNGSVWKPGKEFLDVLSINYFTWKLKAYILITFPMENLHIFLTIRFKSLLVFLALAD